MDSIFQHIMVYGTCTRFLFRLTWYFIHRLFYSQLLCTLGLNTCRTHCHSCYTFWNQHLFGCWLGKFCSYSFVSVSLVYLAIRYFVWLPHLDIYPNQYTLFFHNLGNSYVTMCILHNTGCKWYCSYNVVLMVKSYSNSKYPFLSKTLTCQWNCKDKILIMHITPIWIT